MFLKKCIRCGSFFSSSDSICSNCVSKDEAEINKLKNFFENSTEKISSIYEISANTGITSQNLNRFLENSDISGYLKEFNIKL